MGKIKDHLVGLPTSTFLLPSRGCRRQVLYFKWSSNSIITVFWEISIAWRDA